MLVAVGLLLAGCSSEGGGGAEGSPSTSASDVDDAVVDCVFPTSDQGGELDWLVTGSRRVQGVLVVGTGAEAWSLDVGCVNDGQVLDEADFEPHITVDGAKWGTVDTQDGSRMYVLLGTVCCVHVSVPEAFDDQMLQTALGSVDIGDATSWRPAIDAAVARDSEAGLPHLLFQNGTQSLSMWDPGERYEVFSDSPDSVEGCPHVWLWVVNEQDPSVNCQRDTLRPAEAGILVDASTDEWVALVMAELED